MNVNMQGSKNKLNAKLNEFKIQVQVRNGMVGRCAAACPDGTPMTTSDILSALAAALDSTATASSALLVNTGDQIDGSARNGEVGSEGEEDLAENLTAGVQRFERIDGAAELKDMCSSWADATDTAVAKVKRARAYVRVRSHTNTHTRRSPFFPFSSAFFHVTKSFC